jgi:hypothetical protein
LAPAIPLAAQPTSPVRCLRFGRLLKTTKRVIPRAVFARGMCFFLIFPEKQILRIACLPQAARDDS